VPLETIFGLPTKLEGQPRIRAAFRRAEPAQACAKRRLHLLPFSPRQFDPAARPGRQCRVRLPVRLPVKLPGLFCRSSGNLREKQLRREESLAFTGLDRASAPALL